jgi:glycerol transport system ATP-binding protein
VQSKLNITMIYVTHDQYEALTFAEKVVVMNEGIIIQEGTPEELYQDPRSPFVGYFIGTPGMNVLDCTLEGNRLVCSGFEKVISDRVRDRLSSHGGKFKLGIRPEFVHCSAGKREGWFPLKVRIVEGRGEFQVLTLDAGENGLKSRVPAALSVAVDDRVWVDFAEEKMKIYKDDQAVI